MTSNSGKLLEEITSTSNTTRHQKFRGLLKRKAIKIFRDDLFRFFDYIYTIAPSHLLFVIVMKYLHFIQIAILSFLPYSSTLWPDQSLLGKISKVLSVGATIIPVRSNISVHLFFEIIVYFLYLAFIIFFFICFKIYHIYTKISTVSIKLITIVMNAFLPYLISITSSNLGLDLFFIVMHNKSNIHEMSSKYYYQNRDYNFAFVIFNFILGWIELISMIIFQIIFVTPSLTFRPQAVHILSSQVSIIYFFFIFFFSFSTTFGSIYEGCDGYLSLFFVFNCIIPLGILLYNLYIRFEIWATKELHQILVSLFHMIVVNLISLLTISRSGNKINEISILIFILIFCISYYIVPYIVTSSNKRNIQILNKIEENESILSKIPTNKYLQLLRSGFDTGHPICHSWKLFKMADRKLAKNTTFLIIFAHYAAIYPDESMMLHYVYKLIQKMKHNNIEMKYLAFQINNLLQQRERGLSKTIKKTCTKISDKTEKCRDQLRLVWQSVINGSTSDLDDLASQLKKNEDEVSREYSQLCFVYPNNPYIASAYSAFLSDILCDDRESEEYAKIYRLLRSGARTRVERSYYFATMMIKTLPDVSHHSALNQDDQKNSNNNDPNRSSSIAIGNALINNNKQEDVNEEKTQQRYIEMLIDSVRLPSIRYGPFLLFLVVSLIYPVLSIPLISQIVSNLNTNKICINIMELFSLVRTHLSQITMTSYYYALSKNRYVSSLSSIGNFSERVSQSDENIFLSSVNDCVYCLNVINQYYPQLYGSKLYKTTLPYLNSPLIYFDVFSTIINKTESMWSFQHISSFIGLVAIELSNKKSYQMLKFPELRTLVSNSVNILYQSKDVADIFIDSFSLMNNEMYRKLLYFIIGIGGGMLILALIIIIIVFKKMNQEKKMLYDSFKTLPKSTISSIVDKIDAQSGKHVDQEVVIQPLSIQEQNAMRILNLSSDRRTHINEETLSIVVISIISVIAILFMMVFSIYTQKMICNQFPLMSSTIFDLTRIHGTFFTILLTEMRIAAMNNEQLKSAFPEDVDYLIQQCVDLLNIQHNNYLYLKFGRSSAEIGRFSLTGSELVSLLTNSPQIEDNLSLDMSNILSYISLENKIFLIYDLLYQIYFDLLFQQQEEIPENSSFLFERQSRSIESVQINDQRFELILGYLLNEENQTFLYNGLNFIYQKCESLYSDIKQNRLYLPIIIADGIILICGTVVVFKFVRINERAKWTMKLLLFCPANIVFQSQTISKLLSNDFTKSETDENEESSQFYENVVSHYPDPVVFLNTDMQINSINNAFYMIFKKDINDVKNKTLAEVFNNVNFLNEIDNIKNEKVPPSYRGNVDFEINKEIFSFDVSLVAVNINGQIQKHIAPIDSISMFTLTMTNITETVRLNDNYRKEKESIRKLLLETIPRNFLNQSGQLFSENNSESNLKSILSHNYFNVNNISVVVIEIIGIGSLSSQLNIKSSDIIEKLSSLYNEIDQTLSNYSEMIKVNSSGGAMIAAAGIFNDSIHPQLLSKSALSFAIDSISILERFNSQEKMSLSIKVGIDTGGPAVAGVLDLSRPSFELLGNPVSLAMKMKETGTIMKVHVSQSVYEYLSKEKFNFKEAEDFTFKDQIVKTYLV